MVRIFRGGVLDERFEGSVVVIGPRPKTMTGLVQGDVVNEGGRLYVDKGAVVRGKVIGQTHSAPLPPPEKPVTPPATVTPAPAATTPSPPSSPPKPPAAPGP